MREGVAPYRNLSVVFGARVVENVLALAMLVVLARELGTGPCGAYYIGRSAAQTVFILADLGLSRLILREFAANPSRYTEIFGGLLTLRGIASIGAAGAVVAILGFGAHSPDAREAIVAMCLGAATLAVGDLFLDVLRAGEDVKRPSAVILGQRAMFAVGSIALVLLGYGVRGVLVTYLASSVAFLVLGRHFVARARGSMPLQRDLAGVLRLSREGSALTVAAVTGVLNARVGTTLLLLLATSRDVGLFGAAFHPVESLMGLVGVTGVVAVPNFAKLCRDGSEALAIGVRAMTKCLFILVFPIAVAGVIFRKDIVGALYGVEFAAAADTFAILMCAMIPMTMSSVFVVALQVSGRDGVVARLMSIRVLVHVVLGTVTILRGGIVGAAVALGIVEVLFAAAILWVCPRAMVANFVDRRVAGIAAAALMAGWVWRAEWGSTLVLSALGGALIYAFAILALRPLGPREKEWLVGSLQRRGD